MNFDQLRDFVAVAENSSFTKAARQRYVTQASISYQITGLEQELGVKLLNRTRRMVELTPAGQRFYRDAKDLIVSQELAIKRTTLIDQGWEGSIRIGFLGAQEKAFLPETVHEFNSRYPNIFIEMQQDSVERLRSSLELGQFDLVFMMSYGTETIEGAVYQRMGKIPICAYLPKSHPLSKSKSLRRSDLSHERFVFIDRRYGRHVYDAFIRDCSNSGFTPQIDHLSTNADTAVYMVAAGLGITLLPECFASNHESISCVGLEGENEFVESVAVWMESNDNPAIDLFLACAHLSIAKQQRGIGKDPS